jgi:hypothetical protein
MGVEYKPGDTVELAVKDGGFYDSETEFKIVNDQHVELGKTIGDKTVKALLSGGLLVVAGGKSKKTDDFPEDFPGRDVFIAAGLTFKKVRAFKSDADALKVPGVTSEIVGQIEEWAKAQKNSN